MLKITVPARELWNEKTQEFFTVKEQTLQLEHSLVSVSKWESKWCVPFLSKEDKTSEQILDYIRCMTITQNVDPMVYLCLTADNYKEINDYITAPMTATTINSIERKPNREIVTAELVYYWMIALGIPFECQKWHFNKLLMLIRVCNVKNASPKKMSKREIMDRNRALNNMRRKKLNSKG